MTTINFTRPQEVVEAAEQARRRRDEEGRLLDTEALDAVAAELRRLGGRAPKAMAPIARMVKATGRDVG